MIAGNKGELPAFELAFTELAGSYERRSQMSANLNANAANPPVPPAAPPQPDERVPDPDDRRWFWLTAFQYGLIALVTIIFVLAIVLRLNDLSDLRDMDTARGLITFVITLGTVAIAVMLALTAVVVRDFDKRIGVGKEILTILVGVLGTIVGFYYGAAVSKNAPAKENTQISVAATKIVQSNGTATLTTSVEGGTKPYHYSIKFSSGAIPPILDKDSADGQIKETFALPVPAPTEVVVTIEGKDKDGKEFSFNRDLKTKTPISSN